MKKLNLIIAFLFGYIFTNAQVYTSDKPRNVSIVYFIPSDAHIVPNYEERLSALLLWGQNWYGEQMQKNGYGYKTFGMLKDVGLGRVKIVTINGNRTLAEYSNLDLIIGEVDNYYTTHPGERTSVHGLIILPRPLVDREGPAAIAGSAPFNGYGTNCFAVDREEMNIANLGASGSVGNTFSTWFGGMMHELGHGLNLLHDRQKVSENSDPNYGMSLMWAGNSTLGKSPTFLTAADCAILNNNQVFSDAPSGAFYGAVTATIPNVQAVFQNNAIVVSGKITSSVPAAAITYFNDPNVNNEGIGINKDYNAIAWVSSPINTDSFYVSMPISELAVKDDITPYELKIRAVHTNGTLTTSIYTYKFVSGVPILTFSTRKEVSKIGWTITPSSQSGSSVASRAIDGNATTGWRSLTGLPQQLTVDTKSIQTIAGFSLNQIAESRIRDAEFWTSTDGIQFIKAANYSIGNLTTTQYFDFQSPLNFRYFRLIVTATYANNAVTLGEIGLYGSPQPQQQETLPVTLTSFAGRAQKDKVVLDWITSSETNSSYFEVIRIEKTEKQTAIGKVLASGTSVGQKKYSFTDYRPTNDVNYYKLLQFDRNGSLGIKSNVIAVTIGQKTNDITVNNVSNGEVIFNVYAYKDGPATIYLTNMAAQRLAFRTVNLVAGNNPLQMPINSNGLHLITVDFKTEIISKKFIK